MTEIEKYKKEDKIVLANLFDEKQLILNYKNEQLNFILNQQPKTEWIKIHSHIDNYKYLPIDKIEYLLRKIFKRFRIEVKETKQLFNAVQVTVRVHYFNPIWNEWDFYDGVGAKELQTAKGTGGLKPDFSNVNRGAVDMAAPIAKTVAIKDACDHFGDLFGANLNRKNTLQFTIDENMTNKIFGEPEKE